MARRLPDSELQSFPSLDWTEISPRLSAPVRSCPRKCSDISRRQRSHAANNACSSRTPKATISSDSSSPPTILRRELAGNLVTYVVNRNINFTNICFVGCKFCAFSRGPREHDT